MLVWRGSGSAAFIMTREQIASLVDNAYKRGQAGEFKPRCFRCERDALSLNDWAGEQVARAKWLHIVTANHLRKARKTIRELRSRVDTLQMACLDGGGRVTDEEAIEKRVRDELYTKAVGAVALRLRLSELYTTRGVVSDRVEHLRSVARIMAELTLELLGVSKYDVMADAWERVAVP